MDGLTVLWRGVRYRAGRSLVVLLLATVATTAAAVTPAYARAAQQSVLRDVLSSASSAETTLNLQPPTTTPRIPYVPLADAVRGADQTLARYPFLDSLLVHPAAVHALTDVRVVNSPPQTSLNGQLVYRPGVCAQLEVRGRCATNPGEVMISTRTADFFHLTLGQTFTMLYTGNVRRDLVLTGTYNAKDPGDRFWGDAGYFRGSFIPNPRVEGVDAYVIDAAFAGAEQDLAPSPVVTVETAIWYPMRLDSVGLSQMDRLTAELKAANDDFVPRATTLRTGLPAVLADVQADQNAIATTIPIVAVPLLILALAVLMLLIAALAEERGPEIALAKLHGYAAGQAGRFGLGEVLLLITLAAPLGLVIGFGVMIAVIRLWLAPGVPVELHWPPFIAVIAALLISYASAWVASRRTFRTGILHLLRRVPRRTTWRAGALEGVAVALAGAALVAAWQDRSSGLALLAAPLLALVAGIAGGRILGALASARVARARRQGDVAALLAAAQLSRRPGRQRIVVVVTVAAALMGFAATAWDIAAQARQAKAEGAMGAFEVYRALAPDGTTLSDAVRSAAPDGSAMAVVRRTEYYAGNNIDVVAVQSDRLAKVAQWPGHSVPGLGDIAAKLHPEAPDPITVGGNLTLHLVVSSIGAVPITLAALVVDDTNNSHLITMGPLVRGERDYSATVPKGRLIGIVLRRPPANSDPMTAGFTLKTIDSQTVSEVSDWQSFFGEGVVAEVTNDAGVHFEITATGATDVRIGHLEAPRYLPAYVSGPIPTQDDPAQPWTFPGFAALPQQFVAVGTDSVVPRGGEHGVIVDLDYALVQAADTTGPEDPELLNFEVWTNGHSPADLKQRLADRGIQLFDRQDLTGYANQLGRRAPALALRLYLLAGLVAIVLALGIVALVARIGAEQRCYELAALIVAGVPRKDLRKGVGREYRALLGVPALLGFAVGVVSALFMIGAIPLVTVGVVTKFQWHPTAGAMIAIAAGALACLAMAWVVSVSLVSRATPDLLRGEA